MTSSGDGRNESADGSPGPSDPLDAAGARSIVTDWLGEALGRILSPASLAARVPGSGGWSNDTWMVSVDGTPTAVVRLQPERSAMFPNYDLARQVRCLRLVGGRTDAPVPAVLGTDLDGERFGRPAFVMELVGGRVPSDDRPTFAESGWLVEASVADQRRFHVGLLDAIAAIHALSVAEPEVAELRMFPDLANSNRALVADLRATWEFDRGDRWPQAIDRHFEAIESDVPEPTRDVLLWGDARPANVVVGHDDFVPVALLDWELAAVGSPEHDVVWLAEMNWMRTEGAGLAMPPGFLTDTDAAARYEADGGRSLSADPWYRRFAALRVAVLMHRYLRTMVHAGRLRADHDILADTVASRRLETLEH